MAPRPPEAARLLRLHPTQKAQHSRLERVIQGQDFAHAEGGDEGSLPEAVKLPEIGRREDQGDAGTRAVEAHLDGRQRPVKLTGDDLHDALAGQEDQVGGQIEKNARAMRTMLMKR